MKLRATLTLAVGSRVALTNHTAPELGLVKGATGTVLGFVYDRSDDEPCDPSLSADDAAKKDQQPQVPVVIVNMDSRWYTGDSVGPTLAALLPGFDPAVHTHVVPIAAEACDVTIRQVKYKRVQVPLRLCTASTVHSSQGHTVEEHVMVPAPRSRAAGFTRSLAYVALGRCTCLDGLYLSEALVPRHFTGYEQQYKEVQWELDRLRAMRRPKISKTAQSDDDLDSDADE